MHLSIIERVIEAVRGRSLSVVLPEVHDERVLRAARRLKDERIAEPLVLGRPEEIAAVAAVAGVHLAGIATIDPATSDRLAAYAATFQADTAVVPAVAAKTVRSLRGARSCRTRAIR